MLDAFALLGGNENLVRQMIHRLQETEYRSLENISVLVYHFLIPSNSEEEFIRQSTNHLWGEDLHVKSPFSLEQLLVLLTPLHQDRLPRILAKALLYCGRYQDTKVLEVYQ